MLDWYNSIKNEIQACPTSICTTCTIFENEDNAKIGQIGQIDSPKTEKQLFHVEDTPQGADLKSAPLMVNVNGKPLHCIYCASWGQRSPWWYGVCSISGTQKNNKSRCDLITMEYQHEQ